jgi:hypothetical protein
MNPLSLGQSNIQVYKATGLVAFFWVLNCKDNGGNGLRLLN